MYLFSVHFVLVHLLFFLCSRLFGDLCTHDSTDLFCPSFDLSLLLFSSPSHFLHVMLSSYLVALL
jgi:hypothetical protein